MAFADIRIFAVRSLLATAITLLVSCNATKHVPQGQYLVNKVRIEVKDNPDIDKKKCATICAKRTITKSSEG